MIYQLCNFNHEQIDTFYKVAIINKKALSEFTALSADDAITDIITNLPDTADAIITELLPEDLKLTAGNKISAEGTSFVVRSSFILTPQDRNLQNLLELYQNQEVVMVLDKRLATHIYGTPLQPLLFSYTELHSNKAQGAKGYTISIQGAANGASKILEGVALNIFNRGLAFQLAGSL